MKSPRRTLAALTGAAMAFTLAACSGSETPDPSTESPDPTGGETSVEPDGAITVTDMVGREVTLEKPAATVLTAGPPAEVLLYTFGTEYLAGWNREISPERAEFIDPALLDLPTLGRIQSDGGDLDVEGMLALGVDLIIDAGNLNDSFVQVANDLQEQTGIPVLQFSSDPADLPEVYAILGKVLDNPERAQELADAAQRIADEVAAGAATVTEPVSVYYGAGPEGLNTAPAGSIHSRIIELIGAENAADLEASDSGRVDVDFESILSWDPDVVILGPNSMQDPLAQDPAGDGDFGRLRAIKEDRVFVAPTAPFGWFDAPPSSNQLLGMIWAAEAIYPDNYDFDLVTEVVDFYKTFYQYDLSTERAQELLDLSGVTG